VLELDCGIEFNSVQAEESFFPALAARPAVCLIEPIEQNAEPLLIRTQDLRRRLERLLGPVDPSSKRLNLRDFARGIRYRLTPSKFEQTLTYYEHAKQIFPKRYRDLLRLRPPAVLKVNLRNAYPRCYVTRKIPVDQNGSPTAGIYYGPFASRKLAEAFAERVLDLFKVRRCQIKIRRDPEFPGCLYSEMKMCLAPCFAGCTKEEYDVEVQRLVQFLESSGGSMRGDFEAQRGKASEELDFERAAALHKKVEKIDEVLRGQPEFARRIQDLNAVILQRTAEEQTIGVYGVNGGRLVEPLFLRFEELASQPRSVEEIFRNYLRGEHLEERIPSRQNAIPGDLSEHLWLIARWYYSNPREGEIFFREKDWPYRKILRGCSRLFAPKAEESQSGNETTTTQLPPGAS
jgi:excinuclease ABC subunit C